MSLAKEHEPSSLIIPDISLSTSLVAAALLHNNALSEPDDLSIRALITNYEDALHYLEPEIARARQVLDQLCSQRDMIMEQTHPCRLAIAPHRQLPNEILAKIFVYSSPEKLRIVVAKGYTERSAPYNILLVCSRWKNIALGEKKLWSSLEVNFEDISTNIDVCNFAKSGGAILSRSGLSAISLKIHPPHPSPLPFFIPQMLQNLLLRSESRLRMLTLDLGFSSLQFVYDISPGFFDRLEAILLSITSNFPIPAHPNITLFKAASNLREFTLTSSGLLGASQFCPTVFLLPWPQLITLHLGSMFPLWPADAHMMLRQCSSLVSCDISLAAGGDSSRTVGQPLPTVMPNLRQLRLFLRENSNPWLQDFGLPGLITLNLDGIAGWDEDSDLHPFIHNLHTLENLTVKLAIPPLIAQELLRGAPMLTSLALLGSTSLEDFTLAMIANGTLVPRLSHLICKVDRLSQALDMVESRLNDTHLTTIRDVTITYSRLRPKTSKKRLELIRNGGVSINCEYV